MQGHYLTGWKNSRLPVIPILDPKVNMFIDQKIEIALIAGCALPGGSFKLPAADSLLRFAKESGLFVPGDTILEASSGRMAEYIAALAPFEPYYAADTIFVMKGDVPRAKEGIPVIEGARTIRPEPGLSPVQTVMKMMEGGIEIGGCKKKGKYVNPSQYHCAAIEDDYCEWAVKKILQECSDFNALVVGLGTGGTARGLKKGLETIFKKKIAIIGAKCEDREEIPGMRDDNGLAEVSPLYEQAVSAQVKVHRAAAFLSVPWLFEATRVPVGPSGGATFVATCLVVDNMIKTGEIETLRDPVTGVARFLALVHDDFTPYVGDRFMTEFPLESFHRSTARSPTELIFGKDRT